MDSTGGYEQAIARLTMRRDGAVLVSARTTMAAAASAAVAAVDDRLDRFAHLRYSGDSEASRRRT